MAKIKIWPHKEICPNGVEIESLPQETKGLGILLQGLDSYIDD